VRRFRILADRPNDGKLKALVWLRSEATVGNA
jgi:hypothetical protein